MPDKLTFIHFSDTCNIGDTELISRFSEICRSTKASNPTTTLTVFGGNAFSPSSRSAIARGDHIAPLLNHLGVDVACYGPHDFDFGEARLIELSQKTNFPWLLSNVRRPAPKVGDLLAAAKDVVIKSVGDYRIGFIGLAGTDWPSYCQNSPPSDVWPPVGMCHLLVDFLRTVEGCDFVIAITHMPLVEDLALSEATLFDKERVDLILGGYDQQFLCRFAGEMNENPNIILEEKDVRHMLSQVRVDVEGIVRIVKSGAAWRGCSLVDLIVARDREGKANLEKVIVKHYSDLRRHPAYELLPADPLIPELIFQIRRSITSELDRPLLLTRVTLDGRERFIRRQETAFGNLLADAVRKFFDGAITLFESGGVRSKAFYQADPKFGRWISVKEMIGIFTYDNDLVVKMVQGKTLLAALENSISNEHAEGRFFQVSGLRFVASWQKPEGRRLLKTYCISGDGLEEEIDDEKWYRVAMSSFIASGTKRYPSFKDGSAQAESEMTVMKIRLMLEIFREPIPHHSGGKFAQAIERARQALVIGIHGEQNIPVIHPEIDGRITFVEMEEAEEDSEEEQTVRGDVD